VVAKFVVIVLWSAVLTIVTYIVGLGVGAVIGFPPTSGAVFQNGMLTLAVVACLSISFTTPIAFLPAPAGATCGL
jgi:ABC-type transport system involved in multi-copper enzyme maturation permease subunit